MRPVTTSEWRDAAGGVGCWCDSHDLEICGRRRHAEPCPCRCHIATDLRLVPDGAALKETFMRDRHETSSRYEILLDPRDREGTPAICPECLAVDDDHERWCPQRRRFHAGEQAAAHHIGSVHEIGPGEA